MGKGGKAGIVESLFFSSFQQEELPSGGTLTEVFATVNGGIGGNGAGSGAGGKGGDVNGQQRDSRARSRTVGWRHSKFGSRRRSGERDRRQRR